MDEYLLNYLYRASGNKLDLPQQHLSKNNTDYSNLINTLLKPKEDQPPADNPMIEFGMEMAYPSESLLEDEEGNLQQRGGSDFEGYLGVNIPFGGG